MDTELNPLCRRASCNSISLRSSRPSDLRRASSLQINSAFLFIRYEVMKVGEYFCVIMFPWIALAPASSLIYFDGKASSDEDIPTVRKVDDSAEGNWEAIWSLSSTQCCLLSINSSSLNSVF